MVHYIFLTMLKELFLKLHIQVNKREMKKLKLCFAVIFCLLFCTNAEAQTKKRAPSKKPVTITSQATVKSSLDRGKLLYATNCLACHQADGSGVPNLNPPLIKTSWVLGSKTKLIEMM